MIGTLDQRITFQSLTRAADGMGGATETWATIATVWASVAPGSGSEGVGADRVEATSSYTFKIRNRSDISEADRIQWDGEAYNIRQVRRAGTRAMYLDIIAERGAA